MKKNKQKLAKEWFLKGDHDIETAQFLYDSNRPTDMIAVHIQQATEKYLKGFLIYKSLAWIHRVRRENYKKTKGMSPSQIIEQTKHDAESIREKIMRSRTA